MKKSKFKKCLLIYTLVLLLLLLIFLIYIYFTLKTYEANQTGNYLRNTIVSLDDNTLKSYLKEFNLDDGLLENYKECINSKELTFNKSSDDLFVASLNERPLFEIETSVVKEVTKLGLFTYEERKVEKIIPKLERGLVYYDILIPSNYTLYIDDQVYKDHKEENQYSDLEFMYFNDAMPKMVKYEINNLTQESDIKILDFLGKEVELKSNGYTYETPNVYYHANNYQEAEKYLSSSIDVLDIAHTWSLFLTRDLTGPSYGLGTVQKFLINGTGLNQMAYNWAHSIDITFTSRHTLKNPIWTNEQVDDFKIYSKDAFSCHIYLEKNMIVSNKDQVDIMDDTFYFIKQDNDWKLINIKSGGEK